MGLIVFVVYSPIVWVRTVSYFSKGYILAVCMIFVGITITAYFAL